MEISKKQKKTGFVMVVLAGALWGTTGTVTKYIYAFGLEPATLALFRTGISFAFLYLFSVLTGRRVRVKPADLPFFAAFGVISVGLFNIFYLTAINLTSVTTAVVLLYTAPAFSIVAARIFLNEKITVQKMAAIFLTLSGIVLVVEAYLPGKMTLSVPGVLTGLGAGLTYGVYSIFTKNSMRRGYSTLDTVVIALGIGFIFLAVLRPPWQLHAAPGAPLILWLLVLVVAVFCTMLAYLFFVSGLVHIEAGKATLVAAVEPVVAIFMAFVILGERLTFPQLVGIAAVLAAVRWQA